MGGFDQLLKEFEPVPAGEITTKGLVVPMTKEIYGPALARLKEEGLHFIFKNTLHE